MSGNEVVIKTDVENIIDSPLEYENNLQLELDGLFYNDEDDDEETELQGINEDDLAVLYEDDEEQLVQPEVDSDSDDLVEELENFDKHYVNFDKINVNEPSSAPEKQTLYLTEEEENVIQARKDPLVKQLLMLNRMKLQALKEFYKKLHKFLYEFKMDDLKQFKKLSDEAIVQTDRLPFNVTKVAAPYFKTKSNFPAPPNTDYWKKKRNGELVLNKDFEGHRWTAEEQTILEDSTLTHFFNYNECKLERAVRLLESRCKTEKDVVKKVSLQEEHKKSRAKLHKFREDNIKEIPPLDCDYGVDWDEIANIDLKGRHSVVECKTFWRIYLHPSINKTNWTREENEKIKQLVKKCGNDWDLITSTLNTNRSSYLVFLHYHTTLCDNFKRERFEPEEDTLLLNVIEKVRIGSHIPWGRVAYYFDDRSRHQLYYRYQYYLAPQNIIKGTFTEAEDILLTYLIRRFGRDFSRASKYIPTRTSIQLRNRYANYLDKICIHLGSFTVTDDRKILHHAKINGQRWTKLADDLKRTRTQVRQRYVTLKRLMRQYPGVGIEELPRRKQNYLLGCQSKRNERLAACLEKLKDVDGIPTLLTVQNCLKEMEGNQQEKWRVRKVAPPRRKKAISCIDKELVEFFQPSCKLQREKVMSDCEIKDSAKRVAKLFDILGGDVNLLKSNVVTRKNILSDHEHDVLECLQGLLQENAIKFDQTARNSFAPGTSRATSEFPLIKQLIPPTINTLSALRALIIKYHIYKSSNKSFSVGVASANPMVWKIEQQLVQYDPLTKGKLLNERELFFKRLYALLKWPCVMSNQFAEQLQKEEEAAEDVVVEETPPPPPRKVGRPPKKVYKKIQLMAEAKRKRTAAAVNLEASSTTVQGTKKKRGRPQKTEKVEHVVAYIPRRTRAKNTNPEVSQQTSVEKPTASHEQSLVNLNNQIRESIPSYKIAETSSDSAEKRYVTLRKLTAEETKQLRRLHSKPKANQGDAVECKFSPNSGTASKAVSGVDVVNDKVKKKLIGEYRFMAEALPYEVTIKNEVHKQDGVMKEDNFPSSEANDLLEIDSEINEIPPSTTLRGRKFNSEDSKVECLMEDFRGFKKELLYESADEDAEEESIVEKAKALEEKRTSMLATFQRFKDQLGIKK